MAFLKCIWILLIIMIDILGAYSQEMPNEIETIRGGRSFEDATEAEEVTGSSIEDMLGAITAGTTPEVCGPNYNCAFQQYTQVGQLKIDGDYHLYCQRCVDGFSCQRAVDKMTQKMYVYRCLPEPTTVPITQASVLEAEKRRIGHQADRVEL